MFLSSSCTRSRHSNNCWQKEEDGHLPSIRSFDDDDDDDDDDLWRNVKELKNAWSLDSRD